MANSITGFGNTRIDTIFYKAEIQLLITIGMHLVFEWKTKRIMSCLEILEIRVSQNHRLAFQKELELIMKEIRDENREYTMQSFSRGSSGTDYLLVLFHEKEIKDHGGSVLGQVLMDAFGIYGILHHSIWYKWNMGTKKIIHSKIQNHENHKQN